MNFEENYKCALHLLLQENKFDIKQLQFSVKTDFEKDKNHSSIDDFMKSTVLLKERLDKKFFTFEETLNMLVAPGNKYPVFIELSVLECKNNNIIILLFTSLRFRNEKELNKSYTKGYKPFILK